MMQLRALDLFWKNMHIKQWREIENQLFLHQKKNFPI